MKKLHVTQDDHGFWLLSLEKSDGELQLLAHHFEAARHLVENAHELVADGTYPDAIVLVDPPRAAASLGVAAAVEAEPMEYHRPEPRKAGL